MSTPFVTRVVAVGCLSLWLTPGAVASAQSTAPQPAPQPAPQTPPQTASQTAPQTASRTAAQQSPVTPAVTPPGSTNGRTVVPPPGYVIGPDDVLAIVFWREKDLSAEVVVRPDGMITLPLLEDIRVTGLTPAELKVKVTAEAAKLVTSPNVTVIVKQINSRKVFITGHVARPGSYPLTAPMTVVQLIAMSGGLLEFADRSKIRVMRGPETHRVNYKQLANGEDLKQNLDLRPGDTVIVP
jgi:polysaccharide export outer membrane protein